MSDTPNKPTKQKRTWGVWQKIGTAGAIGILLLTIIFYLTVFVSNDDAAAELVNQLGYVGVVITAFIAGLNAIVPVPAWSFVPIFVAADLWMPLIIAALVVGTMLADLLAFYLGTRGRAYANDKYPYVVRFTNWLRTPDRAKYIIPIIFLYASFAPLPNEVLLVPLALAGIQLRILLIPLLLGTILYQTAFSLGAQSVFVFLTGGF